MTSAPSLLDPSEGAPSVLVTGASGFVGSHLCRALSQNGWRVIAASRRPGIATPGVTSAVLPLLSEEAAWDAALNSVRCVVHLAAHVHVMSANAESAAQFQLVNVVGARLIAERAARAGVRRLVFMSSVKVNGEGGSRIAYRADDVPRPQDDYGASKLEAERVLHEVCGRAALELAVIRPPLVYGPGVRANFRRLLQLASCGLPLPLRAIDNRRSFIGIWNLVSFIQLCLTHTAAAGATWLISDGEDLSTPQLLQELAHLMGKPDRLFAVSPRFLAGAAALLGLGSRMSRLCDSLVIDATPATLRLDWRAVVGVHQGLARTVEAYRSERLR